MEHDIDMDRELEEDNYLCKIRELEEANARLRQELKERERKAALTMLIIAKENILTGDESDPYLSDAEYMQLWESQKLEAKEGE